MQSEIEQQPGLMAANAAGYFEELSRAFRGKSYDMVLLAARGSSDQAALYLRYLLEIYLEVPVISAAPSVWTRYKAKPKFHRCLGVGISQSGAAPDIAEVLEALQEEGHDTLAITNTPDSRITKTARQVLTLEVGPERAVAATKSFSASLLACYQLVRSLGADLPAPVLPDAVWMRRCEKEASLHTGAVINASPVFCLARGINFCSAMETALKLMECALIGAKGYSLADFEHGPKALAGPESVAVVYGEAPPSAAENGCVVAKCPEPPCSEAVRPLWEIFFGQWLALQAARAKGLDPDAPRFLKKITETV